jgi:multidrug efflux system membrane fusion protein
MANESQISNAPPRESIPANPRGSRRGIWIGLVLFLIFGTAGLLIYRKSHPGAPEAKNAMPGGRGGAPTGPVPVVAGTVAKKDVPIYLDGLGTVQAFNTVTVRRRVDGQLQKVAFEEGADVKAGDLLAQIDPAPFQTQVSQAEGKKAQDEALLTNARLELKRDEALLKDKILSQDVYDTQKALVQQYEAAVQSDQAAIDSAKVQLAYTTISAPIDGRAGIRTVDQGNIVRSSDSNGLVVLTQLKPISVVFTLPEQNLRLIQKNRTTNGMAVVAVDRDNKTELDHGTLTVIDNQIDSGTGTIRLKATFPNANLHLWPGQFVNARLLLTTRKGAPIVPASVIQRGPEGAYAFVIKEDQSVEMRPVKVGQLEQEQALIEEGLQPGEKVVVDGQYKLQRGSKVKITGEGTGARGEKKTGPTGKPPRENTTETGP